MNLSKVWKFIKGFLRVAPKLAETAATVAEITGNDEVVGDIAKAGKAASVVSKSVEIDE